MHREERNTPVFETLKVFSERMSTAPPVVIPLVFSDVVLVVLAVTVVVMLAKKLFGGSALRWAKSD